MAKPFEVKDDVAASFTASVADHDVAAVHKMLDDLGPCGRASLSQKSRVPITDDFSKAGSESATVYFPNYAGGSLLGWTRLTQWIPGYVSPPDSTCPAKPDVEPPADLAVPPPHDPLARRQNGL